MNMVLTFTQKNFFWYAANTISSIVPGALVSLFDGSLVLALAILSLAILSLILTFLFIARPTWLFYFFMLFFVLGEVSFGYFLLDISLSNVFGILAAIIIIIYVLLGKRFPNFLKVRQQRNIFFGLMALFALEIISGMMNNSYRPLTTRFSQVISLLFIWFVVRSKKTLWRGFYLGIISVGILSSLTILAGFNLNPIGYTAPISYGASPWETYIHRSIGISQMSGGLHGTYILAFLPLAILLVANGDKIGINRWAKTISAITAILGVLALLVASYRSGWLGLMVSLLCLVVFNYRSLRISKHGKLFILFSLVCILILILVPFRQSIYTNLHNLLFNIRSNAVEARVFQYQYILQRISLPSSHQLFGYGYDDFSSSFMTYVAEQGIHNPEVYPWAHNYYLNFLYATGWPGFILFLWVIFNVMRNLYQQAASTVGYIRILNMAIFASLAGIFTVLFFTAANSGLQIVWILIAASALVNKSEPDFLVKRN